MRLVTCGLVCGLAVIAVAGCGGSGEQRARAARGPFGYDASSSLGFVDRGRVNHDYPIAVRDISYRAGRDRVDAYLVLPPHRDRRLPAVIYVHGAGGDRNQFVVQATWLAARGAVALVITAPSAAAASPAAGSALAELRRQVRLSERDVIAVRRGVDLLRARPDVDPARIGYVGWSAGARTGAIVAGVEPRLRALVLMSGGATPVSVYAATAPKALRPALIRNVSMVDPLRYVRRARAALLLQDGRRDAIVPRAALETMARAARSGASVRWYPAGHSLDKQAYRDQLVWLSRELHVRGPRVEGALTGP